MHLSSRLSLVGVRCPHAMRLANAGALLTTLTLTFIAALVPGPAMAAGLISPDKLGINFQHLPSDLATAAASGVGLARTEVNAGSDTDAVVQLAAAAHLRLYPELGLPLSNGPAADASAMAAYVTLFAQRYGPGGSFWAQHPKLPYLPVLSYEIGNEPDITPSTPADGVSLHDADPRWSTERHEPRYISSIPPGKPS